MPKKKQKSIIKNSLFNMSYNILNLIFPLITAMYVSRILSPDGMGKIAYAQNITSYFITFAAIGLPTYGIREIAKARDDDKKLNKTFTELFLINFITTTVSVLVFIFIVFKGYINVERNLLLCTGITLFFNYINIDWFYQGLEEYVYIVYRNVAIKIFSIVMILLFVKTRQDYLTYALITNTALAGNYVFNVFHARHFVKFDFSKISLRPHIQPLFILGIAVFLSTIYSKIDITMLGSMFSNKETGLYSNAFHLISILTTLSLSFSTVFLPRLSYFYHSDREQFDELLQFGIKVISFFSIPIVVGLIILARPLILFVFGDMFEGSISTIRILSLLIVIKGFGDLLCYQLSIATGHEKERLFAYFASACLNVVLNFLLIPVIGRNGAAIASVFSELLLNLIQYFKMKQIVGYSLSPKPILFSLFSSGMMALGMIAIMHVLPFTNHLVIMLIAFVVGSTIYLVLNFLNKNELIMMTINKVRKHA